MNYSNDKAKAFSLTKLNLDINGNTKRRLVFYKRINGVMEKYKTKITNEYVEHLTTDKIIDIFG